MEQIPSIPNNNNTSPLTIKLYFDQIIRHIRNYKEEEQEEEKKKKK
jgi:hypothetical protein